MMDSTITRDWQDQLELMEMQNELIRQQIVTYRRNAPDGQTADVLDSLLHSFDEIKRMDLSGEIWLSDNFGREFITCDRGCC